MNAAAIPISEEERIIVRERLRLISIAAYIRGAITAAFSCFFLIYVAMFAFMGAMPESTWANNISPARRSSTTSNQILASPSPAPRTVNQGPPPKAFFGIMAAFFGMFVLLGWALAGLTAYAGWCIRRRQRRLLILIVSGVNCIFVPYGTLFGVAAILVMSSPAAKAEFDAGQS